MQRIDSSKKDRRDAAREFYGQSDSDFAEHLTRLGATDPKLRRVFERTRERYLARTPPSEA